jgi:hypothetical protein
MVHEKYDQSLRLRHCFESILILRISGFSNILLNDYQFPHTVKSSRFQEKKKRISYGLLICYFNNSLHRVRMILTMVFEDSRCIGIEDEIFIFSRIDAVALSKLSTI